MRVCDGDLIFDYGTIVRRNNDAAKCLIAGIGLVIAPRPLGIFDRRDFVPQRHRLRPLARCGVYECSWCHSPALSATAKMYMIE
jgi:hypothetical protein